MKNIKLAIAYDGTNYSGWQRQNNARTVQYEIEKALKKILKKDITLHGSGRTDAGVHALGQVASFVEDFALPVDKIPLVVNNLLPKDIVIRSAEEMKMDFHARYCAKGKKYIYKIFNDSIRNPMYRNYSYFINGHIDLKKIIEASKYFIGEHDFRTFMASGSNIKNTIRTIYDINIYKKDKFIILEYEGNGFLYKMVRIITATLMDINFNRIGIENLNSIIKSKDRNKARHTAPAQGLYLARVYY
ncbi:tRNA pseudouridine(38-40) synthase TruA [Maledivibacter halophilus]|uniref:tRNA pseudouridine synthase A n=1 Tax=Maledivibacter halophilus TaxID=36842 RepID=A0A1T5I8T6_9FIRM|nr:tRNA pseudouridine(38-40) synthase TruA [Maledivibacter halophilus]SKC35443.1 tRNA pseudouridine38-40 synthase [Maledivibacter halophilus]